MADVSQFIRCAKIFARQLSQLQGAISSVEQTKMVLFTDNIDLKNSNSIIEDGIKSVKNMTLFHVDRSTTDRVVDTETGNVDTYAEIAVLSRASCVVGSHSTSPRMTAR